MSAVHVRIQAGVCGFVTEVTATADDEQAVKFSITSSCANIQALAAALPPQVDAYEEIGTGYEGELWTAMRGVLRGCCSGCVVPPAIFKAMQVAGGVALPSDPTMHFEQIAETV
ncbi:MAG TPA: hypothetical protein VGL77_05205 [Armatimonadota bacterium]